MQLDQRTLDAALDVLNDFGNDEVPSGPIDCLPPPPPPPPPSTASGFSQFSQFSQVPMGFPGPGGYRQAPNPLITSPAMRPISSHPSFSPPSLRPGGGGGATGYAVGAAAANAGFGLAAAASSAANGSNSNPNSGFCNSSLSPSLRPSPQLIRPLFPRAPPPKEMTVEEFIVHGKLDEYASVSMRKLQEDEARHLISRLKDYLPKAPNPSAVVMQNIRNVASAVGRRYYQAKSGLHQLASELKHEGGLGAFGDEEPAEEEAPLKIFLGDEDSKPEEVKTSATATATTSAAVVEGDEDEDDEDDEEEEEEEEEEAEPKDKPVPEVQAPQQVESEEEYEEEEEEEEDKKEDKELDLEVGAARQAQQHSLQEESKQKSSCSTSIDNSNIAGTSSSTSNLPAQPTTPPVDAKRQREESGETDFQLDKQANVQLGLPLEAQQAPSKLQLDIAESEPPHKRARTGESPTL